MKPVDYSPSEDRIVSDFNMRLWNQYPRLRELYYHIPNGGLRTPQEARKLQAMGVLAGVPDVHMAVPGNIDGKPYHSLYIEFKEPGANMNTIHCQNQLKIHGRLRSAGNYVEVCTSADQAIKLIEIYLEGTEYLTRFNPSV